MNKRRIIFLSVFGVYQLSVFLLTVFMESKQNDFGFLLSLFGKINLFKWGALIGVFLLVAEAVWAWLDSKKALQEQEAMRHENNTLKAKVYDLTQGSKAH